MTSISLVGFMGAGKTAVGRVLAERLSLPFIDLDEEIERREGKSVYAIFAEEGEHYFRRREWEVLQSLRDEGMILSVGGGAYTIDDNIDLINSRSTSVWLECPLETCIERCAETAGQRPLFGDKQQLAQLYKHRLKYYKRANLHIDSGTRTPEEIATEIIDRIGQRA
jgi:shikimate kinase